MSDWPESSVMPCGVITPWSFECLGGSAENINLLGLGITGSTVYPTANMAFYFPFTAMAKFPAKIMFCYNGAAVSGNVDVGIFDVAGTKIVSSGSTVQSGVNAIQIFDIIDTLIYPGLFYIGIAMNNVTGALITGDLTSANVGRSAGIYQQATAFPLPATATFAALTNTYIPIFGIGLHTTL